MDRRTFLCESVAVLIATACGVSSTRATQRIAMRTGACIALVDRTLAVGRALALYADRAGIETWVIDDDIGTLWHTHLARRTDPHTALLAALRASDAFVLARLATPTGAAVLIAR